MQERILVVDDEPKIVKLARDYLEKSGFQVLSAGDGETALAIARRERPDLVVLDLMLPGLDGWDVCRTLRRESDVPIIMLTARAEESDQIVGLELGADDYVTKPFSPRALVARVRALLRRTQNQLKLPNTLRFNGLEINLPGHQVMVDGEPLHLTPNEFRLLVVLAQHAGQTLSRDQLIEQVHGAAAAGFDRSIDSHVKNLRRKLEPDPAQPRFIETVYGVGYRFAALE
ncbi:MAG: response regulator transcription factor [Chloroflexi bacterium]|nr:response regulator transcription factor [Chloroflexota bacterium]MBP8055841.1 response regulator transcription factor [Chloroflexota bacterium]